MLFAIRDAVPQDASSIAQVQVKSWQSTYRGLLPQGYLDSLDAAERAEQWQMRLSRGIGFFLVVEDKSGIFGFLAGGNIRKPIAGYDAELYAIYLIREKQRMGAGRALVSAFAARLEAKGYNSLAVWILAGNISRGFYENLGGILIARDEVELGGELVPEVAYGWPSLQDLRKRRTVKKPM